MNDAGDARDRARQGGGAEAEAGLTERQRAVLLAVRRWKRCAECGASVMDLHGYMRGAMSGDAIRSNLTKLRAKGLIWSYGASMTNALCWHPDPPPEARPAPRPDREGARP